MDRPRHDPPDTTGASGLGPTTSPRRIDAMRITIAFAIGIAGAWLLGPVPAWVYPAVACVSGLVAGLMMLGSRRTRLASWMLLAATAVLGAGWLNVRHHHVAADDLAGMIGDAPTLARLQGTAVTSPIVREGARGSMAIFSHQQPASYFRMRVERVIDQAGEPVDVCGEVLVRCNDTLSPFAIGSVVDVQGSLQRFPPAANPGEFDRAAYARVLGQAGMLSVPSRELVTVSSQDVGVGTLDTLRRWREMLRSKANGWLLSDLPDERRTDRDALLAALLLGRRDVALDDLADTFRRVGLAHLLAISGLHLGIFIGIVLLVVRLRGSVRPSHAWLVILAVLVYLALIEIRMPVMRAAIMTIAGSAGLAFGFRVRVRGLVALSALGLLLWRPQQLFDAGFQLSYGLVLGLMTFTMPLRVRMFGLRDMNAASTSAMGREILWDVVAVSIVGWLIATPLIAHHFGLVSPIAPIAGIVALPIVALVLALGYVKIVLSAVLPSAALFLAGPLSALAGILLAVVEGADAVPFSMIRVERPGVVWTLCALVMVVGWFVHDTRAHRRVLLAATVLVIAWLFAPMLTPGRGPAMRLDMLAVGDGTCFVLRSGGSTVVFDAGSSTNLDAGEQVIIPAFEELGIREIDAIVVSHANLDHFSAVIELVDRFNVAAVYVTQQFLEHVARDPLGPAAFLHDALAERLLAVHTVAAGAQMHFGQAQWTWLHPGRDATFRLANDESMVIRIDVADRRLLLTGDIQREAMALLLGDASRLRADIVELPHHGSYHELAPVFLEAVSPGVVAQSTGGSRFSRDEWAEKLATVDRLVTARDGACWVEVDADGEITTGTFGE